MRHVVSHHPIAFASIRVHSRFNTTAKLPSEHYFGYLAMPAANLRNQLKFYFDMNLPALERLNRLLNLAGHIYEPPVIGTGRNAFRTSGVRAIESQITVYPSKPS